MVSADAWQPIETCDPHAEGGFVLIHAPELIDADFNPEGVVEATWFDDGGWYAPVWSNHQDCYFGQFVSPTHWQPMPKRPQTEEKTDA